MGAHDFKLYNVPFFARKLVNINVSLYAAPKLNEVPIFFSKISEYQCFAVCCPKTRSCASKLLLLRCKLVIP